MRLALHEQPDDKFLSMIAFCGLFPRLMVLSLNPAWSLTIINSIYTLDNHDLCCIYLCAYSFAYQGWSYCVCKRVLAKELEY